MTPAEQILADAKTNATYLRYERVIPLYQAFAAVQQAEHKRIKALKSWQDAKQGYHNAFFAFTEIIDAEDTKMNSSLQDPMSATSLIKNALWYHYLWLVDMDPEKGERADLAGANLAGMDLRGAQLERIGLAWANLEGTNLGWANLKDANLSGADLTSANLEGANLEGANLQGAKLGATNLKGVNLAGADLRGTENIRPGDIL